MNQELKEELEMSKCNGCFRNCSLLYPMCEIGEKRSQKIKEKYN